MVLQSVILLIKLKLTEIKSLQIKYKLILQVEVKVTLNYLQLSNKLLFQSVVKL